MLSGPLAYLSRSIVELKLIPSSMGQRKNISTTPNSLRDQIKMMPLPNIANGTTRRCTANDRKTGNRGLNPSAFGMLTCRYHGARRPETVCQGAEHRNYKHGLKTRAAKQHQKHTLDRMQVHEHIISELILK